jgi:hypothetical protein
MVFIVGNLHKLSSHFVAEPRPTRGSSSGQCCSLARKVSEFRVKQAAEPGVARLKRQIQEQADERAALLLIMNAIQNSGLDPFTFIKEHMS